MSRLQCVGTSSKAPSQDAEAVKPGSLSSRDAPANKSVQSQKQPQKPKLSSRPAAHHPSAITERRRDEGHVDRIKADPEPVSETPSAQQESSSKKTKKVKHGPSRSETHTGLQAPSPADTSTHRQEKSHRPSVPISAEEKTLSAECVPKMPEPLVQVPQYPRPPRCGTDSSTSKAESEEEENECEEEEEDPDVFCAPIELLAEFLKAVMEKKYTLAKKLCQMILIYEPENPEAKHFLPLIEESLLIEEEAQKCTSGEDNTSDEDDEDDDEDESSSGSGDDVTDSDTDSDEENSCSSSSDREEEDVRQR